MVQALVPLGHFLSISLDSQAYISCSGPYLACRLSLIYQHAFIHAVGQHNQTDNLIN